MTQKEKNEIIKILENTRNNYMNTENDIVCVGEKLFHALGVVIQELKQEPIPKDFVAEEIIDEIIDNSFCSDIFNDKTDVEIIKLDTVLNIIKRHLDRIINNRWIPVEEALPNRDKRTQNFSEEVQVTVKDEFGIVVDIAYYDYDDKEWRIELFDDGKVLAWKPLPKPYKSDLCDTIPFDNNKFGG
jgi:hypothetical protein